MSLTQSRQYRRTIETLAGRIERITSGPDGEFEAVLGSLEYKVASEVASILRAIQNTQIAGHQLKMIGSRSFRRPNSVQYDDLISYHNTAALHEAGAYRNRVIRLLRHFERHFTETRDRTGLSVLRNARERLKEGDPLSKIRNEHVHEQPFVPPALQDYASWELRKLSAYRRRQLTAAYKKTARLLARAWANVACTLDTQAEFVLEVCGLLMAPPSAQKQAELDLERIISRFDPRQPT